MNLKWNVLYHNFNSDSLEYYNIFEHGGFDMYVLKHLKESVTKMEFTEKIKCELRYYFWSKAEWEMIITKRDDRIIITPWCGSRNMYELDVTDNKDFDWPWFYDWIAYRKYAVDRSIKIDVFDQVMFNFIEFVNYVWSNKDH